MPLGPPLETVTVRGRVVDVEGNPAYPGTVTLTPLGSATSPSGQVLITTEPIQRSIQSDGTVAEFADILLTDSPGLANQVPYLLHITAQGFHQRKKVELLTTQAVDGVIRLDQLAAAVAPPSLASYILTASMGLSGGPAGPLNADGLVPAAQLPPNFFELAEDGRVVVDGGSPAISTGT